MRKIRKNAYRLLVGNTEIKRPLGRPRCRSVGNIIMELRKIGRGVMCWIDVARDRNQLRALVT
jgi:hypothetical protein